MICDVYFIGSLMVFTIFLQLTTSLPFPPEGYDIKKVQWGVNQERLQLVPKEKEAETSQSKESSCKCGKCAECQRKAILEFLELENRKFSGSSQDVNFPSSYYELYGQQNIRPYFNYQENIIPRYTGGYDGALPDAYFPINNYYPYF